MDNANKNGFVNETNQPRRPRIVVVGSINMDLVIRCGSLPVPGQTITAQSSAEFCGGKGANQAVAAAKMEGDVWMVGSVGDDSFASRLLDNLRSHRIHTDAVAQSEDCPSGLAIVAVESSGQNAIMVVPGANGRVTREDVYAHRDLIQSADVLLLQLEIPVDAVLAAIEIAREANVRIVVDPAPVPAIWTDALLQVDLVCPNETEAAAITGRTIETLVDAEVAARELRRRGAKQVALTLGDRGTLLLRDGHSIHLPAMKVDAVDTTAAGDAFAGALAVRWAETDDLVDAIRLANIAGAIAATRPGAQASMASRQEIEIQLQTTAGSFS
jgi:ribokinase